MQGDESFVCKKTFSLPSYTTVGGRIIKDLKVGWESHGRLNATRNNVILVPHFFSANSHVAGRYKAEDPLPGYWDSIIGPGKPIDTDKYYVISIDSLVNLNSKDGITVTTGPASINPDTGKPYGMSFPVVTIRDFVAVQKALLDSLGIRTIYAAVGVSMGALQSFEWAAAYPEMVERVIAVNGTPSQRPYAMCGLEAWITPIRVDANWNNGDYYEGNAPTEGLAAALYNVAVAAYHAEFIEKNFQYKWADENRNPLHSLENNFSVNKLFMDNSKARAIDTTDANTMLYMARANQLFVAGTEGSSVAAGLGNIKAKVLVIQARTDLLFPAEDARKQVATLRENGTSADYVELDSNAGHIGGVTEIVKAGCAISVFLNDADRADFHLPSEV